MAYMAGETITVVTIRSTTNICGTLIEYGGRQAKVALTLDIDGTDVLLTVDHLFRHEDGDDIEIDDETGKAIPIVTPSRESWEDVQATPGPADENDFSECIYVPESSERVEAPIPLESPSPFSDWACMNMSIDDANSRRRNYLVRDEAFPVLLQKIASVPRVHAAPVYMVSE